MLIASKSKKKRLGVGIHPAVIKQITMLKDHATHEPLTVIDPKTGENVAGIEILFMGADDHGSLLRIWLTETGLAHIRNMCKAIGIDDSDTRQAQPDEYIGKRLFLLIAKVFIYDDYKPRRDDQGNHIWLPEAQPMFFKCIDAKMPPKLPGDPNHNNGIASGDFVKHRDFAIGLIDPPAQTPPGQTDWSKIILE